MPNLPGTRVPPRLYVCPAAAAAAASGASGDFEAGVAAQLANFHLGHLRSKQGDVGACGREPPRDGEREEMLSQFGACMHNVSF